MKPTPKNLRGARVRSKDILGREFYGTVVTHVRDGRWSVDFHGERVTLKRQQFTVVTVPDREGPR